MFTLHSSAYRSSCGARRSEAFAVRLPDVGTRTAPSSIAAASGNRDAVASRTSSNVRGGGAGRLGYTANGGHIAGCDRGTASGAVECIIRLSSTAPQIAVAAKSVNRIENDFS